MFEERNLKLDLAALALLVVVVFLALALLTYSPADPVGELVEPFSRLYAPDTLVYPLNESVANACGPWGAMAADMLLTGLGVGAYYLVASLAVLDVMLLRRSDIQGPVLRTVGWLTSLVGVVALAAMVAPHLSPGPVIGSGGYLGALLRYVLELRFALVGSLIIALSMIVGGLLLCTDYALLVLVRAVAGVAVVMGVKSASLVFRRRAVVGDAGDDEDEYEDEEADEYEADDQNVRTPSVRVRGKRMSRVARDDEEVEVADDEYDYEEDEEADEQERTEDEIVRADDEQEEEEDEEEEEEAVVAAPVSVKSRKKKRRRAEGRRRVDDRHQGKRRRAPESEEKSEREQVIAELNEVDEAEDVSDYDLPDIDLLIEGEDVCFDQQAKEVRAKARILEKTFADFGFRVKVVEIETGPVIAQYEVALEAGLRLSRITGLADDLAIALRVPCVRIVAPIPGKNTVGIEVPNSNRQIVRMREVIEEANGKVAKMRIPLFLGKDVSGNPLTVDLSTLPHLLIAGRTGTGKSVCLNSIITSILMTKRPDEVRLLLIDPKMVELSGYGRLPHLMHPVITDMKKAEAILSWAVDKMEERYALLARAGVRHVSTYNQLGEDELMERLRPESDEERESIPKRLPFIVIVADEMADLMMTAGKEVEQHIIRLAQKSRAVGIHLILATQKPTVDVITGLIKSNLPARISFQVASRTDSRVVLDEMGAEKLLGNGDMLFLWPGTSTLLRGQGTYLTDEEIDNVTDSISIHEPDFVNELVNIKVEEESDEGPAALKKRDDLYESAVDVVVREGRGSVSLLQRALGIGYGRAARLVDFMAEDGIVGGYAGSQAREVLISVDEWERMQSGGDEQDAPSLPAAPPKRRSNKIRPDENWDDDETEQGAEEDDVDGDRRKTAVLAAFDDRHDEDKDEYEEEEEEDEEEEEYEDEEDESDDESDEPEDEYEESEDDEYEEDDEEYEDEDEEYEYEEEDDEESEEGPRPAAATLDEEEYEDEDETEYEDGEYEEEDEYVDEVDEDESDYEEEEEEDEDEDEEAIIEAVDDDEDSDGSDRGGPRRYKAESA